MIEAMATRPEAQLVGKVGEDERGRCCGCYASFFCRIFYGAKCRQQSLVATGYMIDRALESNHTDGGQVVSDFCDSLTNLTNEAAKYVGNEFTNAYEYAQDLTNRASE